MDTHTIDEAARLLERVAVVGIAALCAWFCFGAVACAGARIAPQRRALQIAIRWSPALVRRCAGVACSASVVLSPQVALAAEHPRPAAVVADEPVVRVPANPPVAPPEPPAPESPAPESVPPASPPAASPAPAARTYVVQAGDNLWQIASNELGGGAGNGERSRSEVTSYWRAVVDANRSTLRSGNPNLIYPGEAITLPPVPG